jgi:uncharacterized protein YjbI with pentapeptide repeats
MVTAPIRTITFAFVFPISLLVTRSEAIADIHVWGTFDVIPGTEGIQPGPGVQLDHRELRAAFLQGTNLEGANFEGSNLSGAYFAECELIDLEDEYELPGGTCLKDANLTEANLTGVNLCLSNLTNANLSGADLTRADLRISSLDSADLTDSIVTKANLGDTTSYGFTKEQLYSTATYQAADLQGVGLSQNDLTDWNFQGQNLTGADLNQSSLRGANLTGANLTGALLNSSRLTRANLDGAVVREADFGMTTGRGFTKQQLYSTASYHAKDLQGIGLRLADLAGWDLSGQDLSEGDLALSTLTDTDLSNAIVVGASFGGTTSRGFTKEHLYSTASYQAKTLQGIRLSENDLTGWDLSGQDLANSSFSYSTLANANLAKANLTNADLGDAVLTNANLTGANLTNADVEESELTDAELDSTTIYNQGTVFPDGFDPVAAGLTLVRSPLGDINADNVLALVDIDTLTNKMCGRRSHPRWLPDLMFDLNTDGEIDQEDHRIWVKDLVHTWFGDANLDGLFESGDFVQVFVVGKYEAGWIDWVGTVHNGAGWAEGDWDGNGFFDRGDLDTAQADGGYERLQRNDAVAVPEPSYLLLWAIGFSLWLAWRCNGRRPG